FTPASTLTSISSSGRSSRSSGATSTAWSTAGPTASNTGFAARAWACGERKASMPPEMNMAASMGRAARRRIMHGPYPRAAAPKRRRTHQRPGVGCFSRVRAVSLVLGPVLRHVGETTAQVWVQTTDPAIVRVFDSEVRTFEVAGQHYALVAVTGLTPGS